MDPRLALFTFIRRNQIKKALDFIRDPQNHLFLNQVDANGDTPLIFACSEGMEEVSLELIFSDQVSKNNVSNDGFTALLHACEQGMSESVRALIQNGQSMHDWVCPDTQMTALLVLCNMQMEKEAVQLINTGKSRPNHKLEKNTGAIHIASYHGMCKVVKSLIDTDQINVGESDANGQTPLIFACKNGYDKIALMLIQTGQANISYMDNYQKTALEYARISRMQDVVDILNTPELLQNQILKHAPQLVSASGLKQWIRAGQLQRANDRPSVIRPDGTQEWYHKGTLTRIGAPAIVQKNGTVKWVNEGIPFYTSTPDQIRSHPYTYSTGVTPRYACIIYLGHARLSTKTTAHGIPSIVKRATPMQLNIASMAAPTEECVWPLDKLGDFRRYIEAYSLEFMEEEEEVDWSVRSAKPKRKPPPTPAEIESFFEHLIIQAQKDVIGLVYGKEWLTWVKQETKYPGQQMQWNKSHHYAEKRYLLTEESRGQTGWFIMANNIGLIPGSKLLLPGPYITTTDLMRWFERAGVSHLHMLDVSCSSVYYPNDPQREIKESESWIRKHLNTHTIKLNRSNSHSNSAKSNSTRSNSAKSVPAKSVPAKSR